MLTQISRTTQSLYFFPIWIFSIFVRSVTVCHCYDFKNISVTISIFSRTIGWIFFDSFIIAAKIFACRKAKNWALFSVPSGNETYIEIKMANCFLIWLVPGRGPDGSFYKTDYRCEGENMTISCDDSDGPGAHGIISVVRANFGRFSIAICNKHGQTDWNVNCMAPQTTKILQQR